MLAGFVVVLAVSCADDDGPAGDLSGSAELESIGGSAGGAKIGGYTEQEIGVDYLVNEYISNRFGSTLARYRTFGERRAAEEDSAMNEDSQSLSAEARDRAYFEQAVKFLFFGAGEAMPPEVASAVERLRNSFYDSLDLCAARSQWPEVPLYKFEDGGYYPTSTEQYESARQLYGFSEDEFLDLRHECHKFAASYPALDRGYRDELLATRRDYYLEVLRLWMSDNPEMVVPMTYEQSVNHPYQDYVREVCLAADDPEECARQEGVSLP